MAKKPIPGFCSTAPAKNPIAGATEPPKRFSFSMRYFRQIEKFGVSEITNGWFVSLFDRFQELGSYTVDEFRSDVKRQDHLRYHIVDWMIKNVPIKRNDLNWLPKSYLENEAEYPILQFMISKGKGRVIGFWDEASVFQIVLLDPAHNLQPAKSFEYRVDNCFPVGSEIGRLQQQVEKAMATIGSNACGCASAFQKLVEQPTPNPNVVLLSISDDDMIEALQQLKTDPAFCLTDVFVAGILSCIESNSSKS